MKSGDSESTKIRKIGRPFISKKCLESCAKSENFAELSIFVSKNPDAT